MQKIDATSHGISPGLLSTKLLSLIVLLEFSGTSLFPCFQGSEYISWFRRLECIFVQIRLKMEAGDFPPLNINARLAISVKSYLKSNTIHSCFLSLIPEVSFELRPSGSMKILSLLMAEIILNLTIDPLGLS